jgi:hypothetical protein
MHGDRQHYHQHAAAVGMHFAYYAVLPPSLFGPAMATGIERYPSSLTQITALLD